MNCRVCSKPFAANNAMRRDCCAAGLVHLNCIQNEDLLRCHACQTDPMKGTGNGLSPLGLRPLIPESPMKRPPLPADMNSKHLSYGQPVQDGQFVDSTKAALQANRSLENWNTMTNCAVSQLCESWRGYVAISGFKVGATLLDGTRLQHETRLPTHWGKSCKTVQTYMKKLISQSVLEWSGGCPRFTPDTLNCYRLDQIVELDVRFTCVNFTRDQQPCGDPVRPFEYKKVYRSLGTWDCFLCLSGLTMASFSGKPLAERIIISEINK